MSGAALLALALSVSGCATSSGPVTGSLDPTGIYDITMAAEGMVSEGTMSIRGAPGSHRGTLAAGGVSAEIRSVEVGEHNMTVRAETSSGMLVLRLVGDGEFLSGNWVLGSRRGTFTAERRPAP